MLMPYILYKQHPYICPIDKTARKHESGYGSAYKICHQKGFIMSDKRLYSFNLSMSEMSKLDEILAVNGRNRTQFIEGFIREYNRLYYVHMDAGSVKTCPDCGQIYKGCYSCPDCIGI